MVFFMGYFVRPWLVLWGLGSCIVGGVSAADCAPATGSLTLKTPDDISTVSQCSTFKGNIVVAADGPTTITLSGLKTIDGNLDIENVANLQSLSSPTLESMSSLTLNNLPKLSNVSLPALKSFSSIKWYNLAQLQEAEVAGTAIDGEIQEITIFNTSLKSLEWVKWPVGSQLNISSNGHLSAFGLPYNSINSGSAYIITDNPLLTDLSLSSLHGIYGGLAVSDNGMSSLKFEHLETIGGFVQLSGDYKEVKMPALNQINGALSVTSSEDISTFCGDLKGKNLEGHYDCKTNAQKSDSQTQRNGDVSPSGAANPKSSQEAQDEKTDDDNGTTLRSNIIVAIAISVVSAVVLAAIIAFFWLRHRSRAKVREIERNNNDNAAANDTNNSTTHEHIDTAEFSSPNSPTVQRPQSVKELESPSIRVELAGGREVVEIPGSQAAQEMDAQHGKSELGTPTWPPSPGESWISWDRENGSGTEWSESQGPWRNSERSDGPLFSNRSELPG